MHSPVCQGQSNDLLWTTDKENLSSLYSILSPLLVFLSYFLFCRCLNTFEKRASSSIHHRRSLDILPRSLLFFALLCLFWSPLQLPMGFICCCCSFVISSRLLLYLDFRMPHPMKDQNIRCEQTRIRATYIKVNWQLLAATCRL